MKKIIFSLLLLVVFSSSSIAAEKDYKMCSITGFLLGEKEKFIAGVAMRIVIKNGFLQKEGRSEVDPICDALMEKAVKMGAAYFKRGRFSPKEPDELRLGVEAIKFANKVYDAAISKIDYK
jgi:hypothetical protein